MMNICKRLLILLGIIQSVFSQQVADEFEVIQRPRKEVRQLNDDEWEAYHTAIRRLEQNGMWVNMAIKHHEYFAAGIHNSPEFLPWHRQYLWELEYHLNLAYPEGNGTIAIPYWDWTMDAANVSGSPVFTRNRFGEFPTTQFGCIETDHFGTFSQCVVRSDIFVETMWDTVDVLRCLQGRRWGSGSTRFRSMTQCVEGLHNLVHRGIGGHMGMTYSPYDPIFYSHHANIDRIWYDWQIAEERNFKAYSGEFDSEIMGYTNATYESVFNTTAVYYSLPAIRSPLPDEDIENIPRTCAVPAFFCPNDLPPSVSTLFGVEGQMVFDLTPELDASLDFAQSRVDLTKEGAGESCLPQAQDATPTTEDQSDGINLETTSIIYFLVGSCLALGALVFVVRQHKKNVNKQISQLEKEVKATETTFNKSDRSLKNKHDSSRNPIFADP